MNSDRLNCVVVGLGRIGWFFHAPLAARQPGLRLTAVVDPVPERLAEAKSRFGVEQAVGSIEELKPEKLDLAIISSPTVFHCEQSEYFLRHGIDVFCDKPMAVSYPQALQIAECVRAENRRFMTYQPHRITGECVSAKAILASGKLGRIFRVARTVSGYRRRNDWQATAANGGGMLINYGAHFVDQMFYLLHDSCLAVKCETRRILSLGDGEDFVRMLLTGKSGVLYDVDICMASALSGPEWTICGEYGTAVCRASGDPWHLKYCAPRALAEKYMESGFASFQRQYPGEKIEWIEETIPAVPANPESYYRLVEGYFHAGETPFVPLEETLEVMRTIELARADAARTGTLLEKESGKDGVSA